MYVCICILYVSIYNFLQSKNCSSDANVLMAIVPIWLQLISPTDDKLGRFVTHLSKATSFKSQNKNQIQKILKCLDVRVEQAFPNLLSHCKLQEHWALRNSNRVPNFQVKISYLEKCLGFLYIETHFWEWSITGALEKDSFLKAKMVEENRPEPFQIV